MKVKLHTDGLLEFFCPGCKERHDVNVGPRRMYYGAQWEWNKSLDSPTIQPSILRRLGPFPEDWNPERPLNDDRMAICHSFVTNGKIQFLSDCTHNLAGQTVPLPDLETKKCDSQ